jgi:hypothetical protein
MGPDGLAPAVDVVGRVPFVDLPTLFAWWPPTDASLRAWAVVGVVGSAALLHRRAAPWVALPLAFLYLSFANAGTTFFSFQWDNLLVESLVLVPVLERGRVGRWLAWWLLFRLYVESGLAKVLWSDDWTSGVAMGDYWRTAPLPTPLAWLADRLPADAQRALTWGTLLGEIVAPFALLWRRARRPLFWVFGALQAGILLTANYGVFNWLTLALQCTLLGEDDGPVDPLAVAWAAVLVPISVAVGLDRFAGTDLADAAARWRVANAYHLFASIDPLRDEVEFLGSDDGVTWRRLPLRWKPPAKPAFLAPYHPRVAFEAWFLTLGGRGTEVGLRTSSPPWAGRLLATWCHDPARLAPVVSEPVTAPRFVTLGFWRARMDRETVGAWTVEPLGRHPLAFDCRRSGVPVFPQARALVAWAPR